MGARGGIRIRHKRRENELRGIRGGRGLKRRGIASREADGER